MRAHFRRVGGVVAGVVLVTAALSAPAQAEPASLSGTLTSEATGEPIQGCAHVYTADSYDWAGGACTDESGHWIAEGLESGVGYKVEFFPADASYSPQWSEDAMQFDFATTHVAPAIVDESVPFGREVGEESLSGIVTSDETGQPVSSCIEILDGEDGSHVDSTCADETGAWTVGTLAATRPYKVRVYAYDGAHLGEWAQDASSFEAAESFSAPGQVDVSLARGGVLEGTLTAADGSPVESASIDIYDVNDPNPWNVAGSASTDSDGDWSAVVPSGEYRVRFDAYPAVVQWAFGQTAEQEADIISVQAGGTARVDDQLLKRANVSGMVTSDSTGEGVSGACVTVWARENYPENGSAGQGCADPTGHYSFDLDTTGEFIAEFTDQYGEFLGEFSGDTRDIDAAATFTVTRDAAAVVHASLADASKIAGRAVDARTGAPLENVCPNAYAGRAGDYVRGQVVVACSDADGRWEIAGLAAGSYALRLDPSWDDAHLSTWAFKATSQATADLIGVAAGQDKSVREVKLGLGGTVSGRITDPTGQPVAEAYVHIDAGYPGRAGPGEARYGARTNENGEYSIHGVPAGEHKAFVYGDYWGPWAPEWSGDATLEGLADTFTVKTSKTTRFDASLERGSYLTIDLVTAAGDPVLDASQWYGMIFAADGDYIGDFDGQGSTFMSTVLPSGSFTLRLENPDTGEVVWYDGATSQEDAQRVTLATGEHREITFHLP